LISPFRRQTPSPRTARLGSAVDRMPRYCVIGAGAAGLAALECLQRVGSAVDCFETTDRVGGHWNTDYESLHLITSRNVSGYAGFPMPEKYPLFPSRDQMLEYIVQFAESEALLPLIKFGTGVEQLRPKEGRGASGWIVVTSSGQELFYDGVVVATGHLWDPVLPSCGADFTGQSLHSSQYTKPSDVCGRRVLVVGAGNSGCDIASDLALHGRSVMVAVRHGQVFQPKSLFGRARGELGWVRRLPLPLQEVVVRWLVRVSVGDYQEYPNMQPPISRNLNKQLPVVNSQLLYWIQHGRIEMLRAPVALSCGRAVFADDQVRDVDSVIWATGYKVSLPFLEPKLQLGQRGIPLRTAAMTLPIGLAGLYFIGLVAPRGAQLPVYSAQAEVIARLMALQRDSVVPVAGLFEGAPDDRLDLLRVEWDRELRRTLRTVERLEKS
jgi:thioredoxin reductase